MAARMANFVRFCTLMRSLAVRENVSWVEFGLSLGWVWLRRVT